MHDFVQLIYDVIVKSKRYYARSVGFDRLSAGKITLVNERFWLK